MTRTSRCALGRCAALACLLALAGCATPVSPIPPGTYTDASGEQWVVVGAETIAFEIRVGDVGQRRGAGEYELVVERDGRIVPRVMTSYEFVYGVGSLEWHWDGERIVGTDRRSGRRVEFSRARPAADD